MLKKPTIYSFVFELLDAAEKLVVIWCNWLVLMSFFEADWWHFTEPKTSGISIKAIVILLCSVCLTPMLLGSKRVRLYQLHPAVITLLKIIPSFLLLLSSSPALRSKAWIRTCLLGIGVALIPLGLNRTMSKTSFTFCRNELDDKIPNAIAVNSNHWTKKCSLKNRFFKAKTKTFVNQKQFAFRDKYVDIPILTAILINMSIRYCSGTINIFYENWLSSLCLSIILLLLIALNLFFSRKRSDEAVKLRQPAASTAAIPEDLNLMDNTNGTVQKDGHSSVYSDQVADKMSSNLLTGRKVDEEMAAIKEKHHPFTGLPFTIVVCISGCIHGFTIGILLVLFIWFFSTPMLLVRWSGHTHYRNGIFVLLSFTVGILVSFSIRPEKIVSLMQTSKLGNEKRTFWIMMMAAILVVVFLFVATALLMQAMVFISFFGALLFCVFLPFVFSINVQSIAKIVKVSNIDSQSIRHTFLSLLPGFIAFFTAVAFIFTHILFVLFINPQLTSAFLGKMDLVLIVIDVFIFLSCVAFVLIVQVFKTLLERNQNKLQITRTKTSVSWREKLRKSVAHHDCLLSFVLLTFIVVVICICVGPQFQMNHCISCYQEAIKNTSSEHVFAPNGSVFSVVSWNVLLGHDKHGRDNLPCVGKVLQTLQPQLIGLQESDALPPYWGAKDIQGFLSGYLGESWNGYAGVSPIKASLGVGILTSFTVTGHRSYILPEDEDKRLPHYSLVAIDFFFQNSTVRVFNIHAVFKNWTATSKNPSPYANLSTKQIEFVARLVEKCNKSKPIIVMGDFNLNPNEPQLNILHDIGFKSALHADRKLAPPSTITNRFAVVDHILYRGLTLHTSRTITETSDISDHYPIEATFTLSS